MAFLIFFFFLLLGLQTKNLLDLFPTQKNPSTDTLSYLSSENLPNESFKSYFDLEMSNWDILVDIGRLHNLITEF